MTRPEFAPIMAYVTAATGKSLSDDAVLVYFELLGDLPANAMWLAAKRVVLTHKWATFPTVAELREAATDTLRGQVKELTSAEAWKLAWAAAGKIDPEIEGSTARGVAGLPSLVIEAMDTFGVPSLCHGKEPVSVMRAQFVRIFDQLQSRDRAAALLPESVKRSIEHVGRERKSVAKAIASIGQERP